MPNTRPKSICSIEGCGRFVTGQGVCNRHYRRLRRHGDPLGGQKTYRGTPLAFIDMAVVSQQDECIIWPFYLKNGYGEVWVGEIHTYAHLEVLRRTAGPPPAPHMKAAHAPVVCHNRACINPRHLRWATDAENAADRKLDGTENLGERQGLSKLTAHQVAAIRQDARRHRQIAADHCVSRESVSAIKRRDSWRHIP